ncbi:MAG: UDP-glucose 4-epimerase GalE [Bacteroidales bacterium]
MSTLLITGGAGYIGSHTAHAFADRGDRVVVLDDLSTGYLENLPKSAIFCHGNAADRDLVSKIIREHRPDALLHFAGSITVPESIENPLRYYQNNVANSIALFQSATAEKLHRVIFSSTAAVYGRGEGWQLVPETATTAPIHPYGWSKLCVEQILRDMGTAYGTTYAILRYFNVAGADKLGRTGQRGGQSSHLIRSVCEVALGIRSHLSIFGADYETADGTCVRDFIHVSDLARAHVEVFDHLVRHDKSVCLNCGNGRGYSVAEVVHAAEALTGRRLDVRIAPRRPGDPAILLADPSALMTSVGWRPEFNDIAAIIASALTWERKWRGDRGRAPQ